MIRNSLFFRLMGAFALVILAGVVVVTFIANQTTTNEFQQYMFRGQMVQLGDLAGELANYYRARGSWEGVDNALRDVSNSMMGGAPNNGAMMGVPNNGAMGMSSGGLWLADTRGSVATRGEGTQNLLCAYLGGAVLLGLLGNTLLGWWWLDPIAALVVAAVSIREGRESWRGEGCCARC